MEVFLVQNKSLPYSGKVVMNADVIGNVVSYLLCNYPEMKQLPLLPESCPTGWVANLRESKFPSSSEHTKRSLVQPW